MTGAPISAIAYAGADHSRAAARAALITLLDPAQFGDFKALRAVHGDPALAWPAIKNADLVTKIHEDDPTDVDWDGIEGVHTRLAVISEKLRPEAFLGGPGAEVPYDLAIDWLVVTNGAVDAWRLPTFDTVLSALGLILHDQMRSHNPGFTDLDVGDVDLLQFDLGDHSVASASIAITLTLDADTLFA